MASPEGWAVRPAEPAPKASPPAIAPEDSAAGRASGAASSASSSSLASLSRQSSLSLDWQLPPASKRDAKAINARLMQAQCPQDIFDVVSTHMPALDSINTTAALQRLAKMLSWEDGMHGDSGSRKEAVLSSPIYAALTRLMAAQCNAGLFNAQSTANAWWAVAKLHGAEHPASIELVAALEGALAACLTAARECDRPNAQACSSIWYSWGRTASGGFEGYVPSPAAAELLWDRTLRLSLAFDAQGAANMLWAFGLLAKRYGPAFPIRPDVLAAMAYVVARLASSFAVQGLSCATVGCANLGPALRASATPITHLLVAEALCRVTSFSMQAMANMASALAKMGADVLSSGRTRLLLAAFDAHAAALPPTHKPQDAASLTTALRACGLAHTRLSTRHMGSASSSHAAAPPLLSPPQQSARPPLPQQAMCLRDSTNQPSPSPGGAPTFEGTCPPPTWIAPCPAPPAQQAAVGMPPAFPPQHVAPHPPPPPHQQLASLVAQLAPGAATGPLTITGYSVLAHQLAATAAAAAGRAFVPVSPPPQALPLPVLVAPVPMLPGGGGAAVHSQHTGWGGQPNVAPPPAPAPPAAVPAPSPPTSTDPLRLQAILAALQAVQLQRAGAGLHASPGQL